jgi:hypothetical protein
VLSDDERDGVFNFQGMFLALNFSVHHLRRAEGGAPFREVKIRCYCP